MGAEARHKWAKKDSLSLQGTILLHRCGAEQKMGEGKWKRELGGASQGEPNARSITRVKPTARRRRDLYA